MKRQQVLDPTAEGRLARELFAYAFMSDTKWRKMIRAVGDAANDISQMTVKFIDVAEPRHMRFPPSLSCPRPYMDTIEFGPVALRSIEWMEFPSDLTDLLNGLGRFMIEVHDESTRVIGYGRG
jgi:hypothetical protein